MKITEAVVDSGCTDHFHATVSLNFEIVQLKSFDREKSLAHFFTDRAAWARLILNFSEARKQLLGAENAP